MTIITIYQTFPIANVFPLFFFFDLSKHIDTSWLWDTELFSMPSFSSI